MARASIVEMAAIHVRSYDFAAGLHVPRNAPVDFSRNELLTAIVSVGKSSADQLTAPHRILQSWREIVWRIALLDMSITHRGSEWCRSDAYEELDPSEKVGVSYMLGMTAASVLCTRFLHMPFLMHLDVYTRPEYGVPRYTVSSRWGAAARRALNRPSRRGAVLSQVFGGIYPAGADAATQERLWSFIELLAGKTRPDLFGLETSSGYAARYVIVEAKGRSGSLTAKDNEDCVHSRMQSTAKLARPHGPAMLQALTKDRVAVPGGNPVPVGRHLATFSHFRPDGLWCFSWKDPEEEPLSGQERTNAPPGRLIADFYSNLLALGMVERARGHEDANENAEVTLAECPAKFIIPGTGLRVGVQFHPEVHAWLCKAFSRRDLPPHELLNDMPELLHRLEGSGEIGPKTRFGINGVRIAQSG